MWYGVLWLSNFPRAMHMYLTNKKQHEKNVKKDLTRMEPSGRFLKLGKIEKLKRVGPVKVFAPTLVQQDDNCCNKRQMGNHASTSTSLSASDIIALANYKLRTRPTHHEHWGEQFNEPYKS